MLETTSRRLREKGMPHFHAPDKEPATRIRMHEEAGELKIPFTSGMLLGIGENDAERIDTLWTIRELSLRWGHIQEAIIQPFHPKPDTKMRAASPLDDDRIVGWVALARLLLPREVHVQAPPNLGADMLPRLLDAGVDDWGGVSPITVDFINPEAPWPALRALREDTEKAGFQLFERGPVYPDWILERPDFFDPNIRHCCRNTPTTRATRSGTTSPRRPPSMFDQLTAAVSPDVRDLLEGALEGKELTTDGAERLLGATGTDFHALIAAADLARQRDCGDDVTYVVCRNINFTNVCYVGCSFCGFARHKDDKEESFDRSHEEILAKCKDAIERGATEVCIQGGIHPNKDHHTYRDILKAIKAVYPTCTSMPTPPKRWTSGTRRAAWSCRSI